MDGTEELVDVIAPRKESTLFCLLELRSTGREEWRENTQATAQGMGRRPAREKEKRTQRQTRTRTHIMGARVPVQVDERRMPHKGKVLLGSNRGLCSLFHLSRSALVAKGSCTPPDEADVLGTQGLHGVGALWQGGPPTENLSHVRFSQEAGLQEGKSVRQAQKSGGSQEKRKKGKEVFCDLQQTQPQKRHWRATGRCRAHGGIGGQEDQDSTTATLFLLLRGGVSKQRSEIIQLLHNLMEVDWDVGLAGMLQHALAPAAEALLDLSGDLDEVPGPVSHELQQRANLEGGTA